MADEADVANLYAEMAIQSATRIRMHEAPKDGGKCLYCGEKLPLDRRFCDADCRDDYQKYAH